MRFSLYFSLAHTKVPIEIRRAMISFIKHALTEAEGGKYYPKFFDGTVAKNYSFAVVLDAPTFSKEAITLKETRIKVTFSVANGKENMGRILLTALIAQQKKTYPLEFNNIMKLEKIKLDKEVVVQENTVLVRTSLGGGIVVRRHDRETNKDLYLSYGDEAFADEFQRVVEHQLESAGLAKDSVTVKMIEGKRVIVPHFELMIPVSIGFILLEGNKFALQYLLDAGIGSRRSQGFGKIDKVML